MTTPADFLSVPVSDGTGNLDSMGPDSAAHHTFHAREATAIGVLQNAASFTLFDRFVSVGNVGTGEDDLYSDTLTAGLLATNGDKVHAFYGGTAVAHATATREIKVYFGGTAILDTTAQVNANGGSYAFHVEIIRVSASVVRAAVVGAGPALTGLSPLPFTVGAFAEITGLTLANTQILKITGEAAGVGAATNDIVMKMGYATFHPAA